MANENIGEIECAWCGEESPVRKRKDGKLYVMCPSCGQQFLNGPGGQDIILTRATIYGVTPAPENPVPKPPLRENPAPAREKMTNQGEVDQTNSNEPKPKKSGSWFDDLLS